MRRNCLLLGMVMILTLAGCGGDDDSGPAREPQPAGMMEPDRPAAGMGRHGIGSTFEYVTTYAGGATARASYTYTGYEVHRGRDVLVVEDSEFDLVPTLYWDLGTGNWMASLDADGEIVEEQTPHGGVVAFPMVEGTTRQWTSTYCCAPDVEPLWVEFTVEACGIELEVPAGAFTVCRIVATDVNWFERAEITIADVDWVTWYDPEQDLEVRRRYADPWTELGVTELLAYELAE